MDHGHVLIFDEGDDEEDLYTSEDENGVEMILAFEDVADAEQYALSRCAEENVSVARLDIEALVVSTNSFDDLRIGVVFSGDLTTLNGDEPPLVLPAPAPEVEVEINLMPGGLFSDSDVADASDAASDALDVEEQCVWALVHDEGTTDAHFFSVSDKGLPMVLCFRAEEAASQYASSVRATTGGRLSAVPYLLGRLMESLYEQLGEKAANVCLLDDAADVAELPAVLESEVRSESSDAGVDEPFPDTEELSVLRADGVDGNDRLMLDRLFYKGWGE